MASLIAQTILDQVGQRPLWLLGASDLIADDKSLMFKFRGCKQYSKIRITLNALDLYDIEFIKLGRAPKFKVTIDRMDNVYATDMHKLIEQKTGLYLSL
jgi:hypothetical protein